MLWPAEHRLRTAGAPAGASHRCCGLKPGGHTGSICRRGARKAQPAPPSHRLLRLLPSKNQTCEETNASQRQRERGPRSAGLPARRAEEEEEGPPATPPPRHPPPSQGGRRPRRRRHGRGPQAGEAQLAPRRRRRRRGRGGGLLLLVVVELGGVRSPRPVGAACSRECRRGMAPVGVALLGAGTFARDAYAGVLGEVRAEPVVLRLQRSSGSDGSGGAAAAARVRPAPPLPLPPRPEAANAPAILDVTVLDGSCSSRRRPQEEVIPGC